MTALGSIILGALQGITEFLPISSSAHLIIAPWLFHMDEGNIHKLTFDVMLHFGTLLAILLIYGKRFFDLCVNGLLGLRDRRIANNLLLKIIVATIPAAAAGLLFKDFIELYLRVPYVTVISLLIVSILMVFCERIFVNSSGLTYTVAILIGIAQALALVPGTSRSGITITIAILLGLRKAEAVDFSFLLSIPIILGTTLYEARHLNPQGESFDLYLYGMLSAFLFGFLSLKFLIEYLKKHSLDVFACYRVGLALLILLLSKP